MLWWMCLRDRQTHEKNHSQSDSDPHMLHGKNYLVKSSLAPEQNFVLSSKCHLPVAFPQAFSLASMLYCTGCNLSHLIAADICQMRTATDAEDSVWNPPDLFCCYASACGVNIATNLQAFHAEYHLSHPDWLKLPVWLAVQNPLQPQCSQLAMRTLKDRIQLPEQLGILYITKQENDCTHKLLVLPPSTRQIKQRDAKILYTEKWPQKSWRSKYIININTKQTRTSYQINIAILYAQNQP